ncbi:MAG: hypothetical protein KKG59_01920 [Nanoarchaeota archaeon]|nr:hypothetical protein [Nanoarchaeota archaeon]
MSTHFLLRNVKPENNFVMINGHHIRNMHELARAFCDMPLSHFSYHMNEEKNDFANWVGHSMGDTFLASQLLNSKNQDHAQTIVNARALQLEYFPESLIADEEEVFNKVLNTLEPPEPGEMFKPIEPVFDRKPAFADSVGEPGPMDSVEVEHTVVDVADEPKKLAPHIEHSEHPEIAQKIDSDMQAVLKDIELLASGISTESFMRTYQDGNYFVKPDDEEDMLQESDASLSLIRPHPPPWNSELFSGKVSTLRNLINVNEIVACRTLYKELKNEFETAEIPPSFKRNAFSMLKNCFDRIQEAERS